MIPRQQIKQCFQCKNNIECWGLNEDIPIGVDERTNSISAKALTFFIANNLNEDLSIAEQFGSLCGCFLASLKEDQTGIRRDIYQMISVLCAICNTPNDGWECPADDPKSEDNFSFERINDLDNYT